MDFANRNFFSHENCKLGCIHKKGYISFIMGICDTKHVFWRLESENRPVQNNLKCVFFRSTLMQPLIDMKQCVLLELQRFTISIELRLYKCNL